MRIAILTALLALLLCAAAQAQSQTPGYQQFVQHMQQGGQPLEHMPAPGAANPGAPTNQTPGYQQFVNQLQGHPQPAGGGSQGPVDFTGRWIIDDTKVEIEVVRQNDGWQVTELLDDDGEHFTPLAASLRDNLMSITYHVPSTNYVVVYQCRAANNQRMDCRWYNSGDRTGPATVTRIR